MEHNFENIESTLQAIETEKDIRIVTSTVPYDENIILHDFSLESKGLDEDKVYAMREDLRSKVRRGNTIIRVFKNGKIENTIYGRKGFEKFFDLIHEYMLINLGELKNFDSIGFKDNSEHVELTKIIFSKAEQILKNSGKVGVYKSRKANGENAQVSWCGKLGAWVISSKNVSLLARTHSDIKEYKAERFNFAKLIATVWFNLLNNVEKSGRLDELKNDMNEKTFVAEYCGNQDYQHLVKYDEIDLYFYAIVDNNSNNTCISPKTAFDKFKSYGFKHVECSPRVDFTNYLDLNKKLLEIYKQTAESAINEEEEGSVIYLVGVDENDAEVTLSLSKLKTLEYRIYRKLREKLKGLIRNTKKDVQGIYEVQLKRFETELNSLCRGYKTPAPLEYYIDVAEYAMKYVTENIGNCSIIEDKYITFLSVLLQAFSQKVELKPEYFSSDNISLAMKAPWTDYYKNYQPQLRKVATKFSNKTKVFIIVPLGITGMGKTFLVDLFFQSIKESSYSFEFGSVSSDECRNDCMEELAKTSKKLSRDQLYEKTMKKARELFERRLKEVIQEGKNKKSDAYFVFIDKNHPPNAVSRTLQSISEYANGLDYKIIALTPQVKNYLEIQVQNKTHRYPFSKNLFFTCLDRVQKRTNHPTLPGSGSKSAGVCVMFLDFYRNVNINKESLKADGFDIHMEMPFSHEDENLEVSEKLMNKLVEIIECSDPGNICKNEKLLEEFSYIHERENLIIRNPEKSFIKSEVKKFFEENIAQELFQSKLDDVIQEESKLEETKMDQKETKIVEIDKKIPVYLGIFSDGNIQEKIEEFIKTGLGHLVQKYKDSPEIATQLYNFENKKSKFRAIPDIHITTLYIGKDKKKLESENYQSFKEGVKVDLSIPCFVIVPNKIVTGICYPDQSEIQIENEFPHVTLMKGDWEPKFSNNVMDSLFSARGKLNKFWVNNGFEKGENVITLKEEIKVDKDKVTAYIVKMHPPLVIPSTSKKYVN